MRRRPGRATTTTGPDGARATATPPEVTGPSPYARGALGLLLMSAAAFGLVQMAFLDVPAAVLPWAAALKVGMGALGARLALTPNTRPSTRAHLLTHAMIGGTLVTLPILMSWNPSRSSWAISLVIPVLWGLHFRIPGALLGTTTAAATIVAAAGVGDAVHGFPLAPWAVVWQVGLATALGLLCGLWAHSTKGLADAARRERQAAEQVAARERELSERLAEMDELRTAFVAATSHELRTPLTTIAGFAATLRRQDLHADEVQVEQMLGAIERAAGRLTRLVEDLRTAAKPEMTSPDVSVRPVSVMAVAEEVVATVGQGRSGTLGDPGVRVLADPARLYQVLANLVGNACQHGAGPVQVHWRTVGAEVEVVVTDDGPGIPTDQRDRIFERFVRGNGVESDGQGLGLAIARELCELMDGTLELDTTARRGASFVVTLPATDRLVPVAEPVVIDTPA